ncbi:hypothetical protein ACRRTK_019043 [Alexandromys fortis]
MPLPSCNFDSGYIQSDIEQRFYFKGVERGEEIPSIAFIIRATGDVEKSGVLGRRYHLLPSNPALPRELHPFPQNAHVSDAAFKHWKAKGSTWESLPQALQQQQTCHEHACCWTQRENEQNPPQGLASERPGAGDFPRGAKELKGAVLLLLQEIIVGKEKLARLRNSSPPILSEVSGIKEPRVQHNAYSGPVGYKQGQFCHYRHTIVVLSSNNLLKRRLRKSSVGPSRLLVELYSIASACLSDFGKFTLFCRVVYVSLFPVQTKDALYEMCRVLFVAIFIKESPSANESTALERAWEGGESCLQEQTAAVSKFACFTTGEGTDESQTLCTARGILSKCLGVCGLLGSESYMYVLTWNHGLFTFPLLVHVSDEIHGQSETLEIVVPTDITQARAKSKGSDLQLGVGRD